MKNVNNFISFRSDDRRLIIKDQLTILYVTIVDFLREQPQLAQWRTSNNHLPDFTDAEVLTIALMQQPVVEDGG